MAPQADDPVGGAPAGSPEEPTRGALAGAANRDAEAVVAAERAARSASESLANWWLNVRQSEREPTACPAIDDPLRQALHAIRRALGADAAAILVANERGDELIARASVGLPLEVSADVGIRAGEGIAGRVLSSGIVAIIEDATQSPLGSHAFRDSELRSFVAVPIESAGTILGVLFALSHQRGAFTRTDAAMLELFAERLAGALARARVVEIERGARLRAEELAQRLARLQLVTASLLSATTVEDVGNRLVELLSSTTTLGDAGAASLWVREGANLRLLAASGPPLSTAGIDTVALGSEDPIAVVVRTNQPLFLPRGDALGTLGALASRGTPIASLAVLPLSPVGQCIGALVVCYSSTHPFDEEERAFLTAIANQAAPSLDRARLHAQVLKLAQISGFFAQAARTMAEASSYRDTLDRLAQLALPALGDLCLIDVVDDEGAITRMVARHREPAKQSLAERLRHEFPPDPEGSHPAVEVIRRGTTQWAPSVEEEFIRATTKNAEHFNLVTTIGLRSYLSVPLVFEGAVVGAVTFISSTRSFDHEDVAFAEALAEQVAAVVANARRSERASHTSHILQQRLLPQHLPSVPGLEVASRYLTGTRSLEVGGDFYDLLMLSDGQVRFAIGDVAGHDSGAAAIMGQLRSAIRALAAPNQSPAELLAALKASWEHLGFDRIATVVLASLDPRTGALALASAGHHPPLLIGPDSAWFLEVPPTSPLGAPETDVGEWHGLLPAGHVLLLYTDGAIEQHRMDPDQGMAVLASIAANGPVTVDSVCERLARFLEVERTDDVALLAVARRPDDRRSARR